MLQASDFYGSRRNVIQYRASRNPLANRPRFALSFLGTDLKGESAQVETGGNHIILALGSVCELR